MKRSTAVVLFFGLTLTGCGKKQEASASKGTNAPVASGNPITAPVDYLGGVAKGKTTAEKVVDTASLNQAINLFNASEGRFPKDLNELVKEGYLTRIPEAPYGMKITYDASKGEVKVVRQ